MLNFLRPYLIYIVLAGAVLSAGAGYKLRDMQCKADAAKQIAKAAEERLKLQGVIDTKSALYEAERDRASVVNTERHNTIREIFRDAPAVSPDCAAPPELGRVLTQSVLDANSAATGTQSGSSVPAAEHTP
jgi:hypothetical protein